MDDWQSVYERSIWPGVTGAIVPLRACGLIRVTGTDRAAFLHNMCTNDIRGLQPGAGCEALFTDVKGKIVSHAFVLVAEDAIRLLLLNQDAAKLIVHLDRYIIREDVQLADESHSQQTFAIFGAGAWQSIERAAGRPIPALTAPWQHVELSIGGTPVEVIRCDLTWCGGSILLTKSDSADRLVSQCAAAGAVAGVDLLWHVIRVESGWPLYGIDFDESNLPQELNRDAHAIHFRKGCYLGQETVARIDALGRVNKRLAMISLAGGGVPQPGAEIYRESEVVGRLTSCTWSPRRQAAVGIAMLRRGTDELGTKLLCAEREAEVISSNLALLS